MEFELFYLKFTKNVQNTYTQTNRFTFQMIDPFEIDPIAISSHISNQSLNEVVSDLLINNCTAIFKFILSFFIQQNRKSSTLKFFSEYGTIQLLFSQTGNWNIV